MARRSREEWFELLRRQERSGDSVAEFCRQNKLTENSFYRWRRLLSEEEDTAKFVPVTVVGARTVELELPCGATVRLAADRDGLREVFAALLSVESSDA